MKNRFKSLDTIAAALLIGTVGAMAMAQAAPPTPAQKTCPGGTYVFPDGHRQDYDSWMCPANKKCAIIGIFVEPNEYYVNTHCFDPA
jgi:hypothetical protein